MRGILGLPLIRTAQLPTETPSIPAPPPAPGPTATGEPVTVTKEQPIQTFGGDYSFTAGQDVTIDATQVFGDRCTGIVFQGVVGTVQVSINSSPLRSILTDLAINNASIRQLRVITGAASSVVVQLHGV